MRSDSTSQESWSLPKRITFRFGVIAAALLFGPWFIALVPGGTPLMLAIERAWHWLTSRFAEVVLGIELPPLVFTGSGDQLYHYVQLLLVVILATLGTLAWSWRTKRRSHARLAAGVTIAARYFLAVVMVGYGVAKLLPGQFPPPWIGRYDGAIGDMSPMGLLWTFMGHSQPYTKLAGGAEVLGAALLLSRRLYVIGALVIAIVMTNVVALNFCYDVPVKLFSSELLLVSIALVLPQARRIIAVLIGRAAPEVPPRVRGSIAAERIRRVAKAAVIGLVVVHAYDHAMMIRNFNRRPVSPLEGVWRVDSLVVDGVERPALFTDNTRWRKLIFSRTLMQIRYGTDRRLMRPVDIDTKAQTITFIEGGQRTWHYTRPDAEHLILERIGMRAALTLEPPPPLTTRGFHWVNESPYNR
jgi:hypothetical protein